MPIVDTVERLQGQSVDVIIVSTVVSDESYYQSMKYFILDPHRLNVMFSRSKEKILITKSSIVEIPKLWYSSSFVIICLIEFVVYGTKEVW